MKQLASARFLMRKLGANEYEVDGYRVQVGFRDGEPLAFPMGMAGDDEVLGSGEPLQRFLQRAARAAAAREAARSRPPSGDSSDRREAQRPTMVQSGTQGCPGSLAKCDSGSFLIACDGGSFYSVTAPIAAVQQDPFAKSKHSAGHAPARLQAVPMHRVQQVLPAGCAWTSAYRSSTSPEARCAQPRASAAASVGPRMQPQAAC